MANKTFLNLPQEKQEEILNAAMGEFITHDYSSASLNQIISELGIAKGSFYRYFDSKKDLYLYLLDYCKNKKYSYLVSSFDRASEDFYGALKNIMLHSIKFNVVYPLCANFLIRAFNNKMIGLGEFLCLKDGNDEFLQALERFQKAGVITSEFDKEFIFFCISKLIISMESYIKNVTGINGDLIISDNSVDEKQLDLIFDKFIEFFKNGLNPEVK